MVVFMPAIDLGENRIMGNAKLSEYCLCVACEDNERSFDYMDSLGLCRTTIDAPDHSPDESAWQHAKTNGVSKKASATPSSTTPFSD
jgi:hypothetical protein